MRNKYIIRILCVMIIMVSGGCFANTSQSENETDTQNVTTTPIETTTTPIITTTTISDEIDNEIINNTENGYTCFKGENRFEYDENSNTICYAYIMTDKMEKLNVLSQDMYEAGLLKDRQSIRILYDSNEVQVTSVNDDIIHTYNLVTKEKSCPFYNDETKELRFCLDSNKSKNENYTDIFNFIIRYATHDDSIISMGGELDDAIEYGAFQLSLGKPVDGTYKELYSITLYTTGTYSGYNGTAYNGTNPSVQEPVNDCKIISSDTIECEDGIWSVVDVDEKQFILIDSNEKEYAFNPLLYHNGYEPYFKYAWIGHLYINDEFYYISYYDSDAGKIWYTDGADLIENGTIRNADDFIQYLKNENVRFFYYQKEKKDKYYEHIYPDELEDNDEQLMRCYYHLWYMRDPDNPTFVDNSYQDVCPISVNNYVNRNNLNQ